ncbi:acyl-CoA dehydrogenase family protein [Streptomyces apricus]|uniref:Acyl-CoA oxidase n=1 Tax=Streptomyces apricus TaxID=1828112 RepID=A0A5A9ZVG2_9ACTN|nr:acyl-CoA dehydrogenase [Streptomyces apricus]KAA0921364.1 acyl-CoA oxidase [Streptomyces apricus]
MLSNETCLELRDLLFHDGPEGAAVHAHWRKVIGDDLFRHHPATCEERWQLSYDRLRRINEELPLPPDQLAHDPRHLAALHEWASVVDGATATVAGIHYNLFLGSLLDDDRSAPRDLSDFMRLSRVGTFLCTERAHGNDAPALETVARYDRGSDEFVLHTPHPGAAKFMPNTSPAGGPKTAVVAARLLIDNRDEGVFLFLTPLSNHRGALPGVSVTSLPERIGSPVDHCVTSFDRVRLPRTTLVQGSHGQLDADGTFHSTAGSARKRFLHTINRVTVGKLCMSASTLGGARAALAIAVRYAGHRHVSGPAGGTQRVPISAYRSHHGRLLEKIADAYAMTFWHRTVTDRWITHAPAEHAPVERLAAIAKGWITWRARDITIEARERCGARALFPANGLAEFPANTDGAITAEGDNLAVWSKAGAEMIFGHELRPASPHATGAEQLTDVAFLRRALAHVERQAHLAARHDLRAPHPDREKGSFVRWNNATASALALVEAYAVGQAADAFTTACTRAADTATRTLLNDLCALFMLRHVRAHDGPLLADGILTADHVQTLPGILNTLTSRLAPHLDTLAHAFDIPEEHLSSLPMLTD